MRQHLPCDHQLTSLTLNSICLIWFKNYLTLEMFVLSSTWISTCSCSLILPTPTLLLPTSLIYKYNKFINPSLLMSKLCDSLYPWHFSHFHIQSIIWSVLSQIIFPNVSTSLHLPLTTSKFLFLFDKNDQSSLLNIIPVLLFSSSNLFSFLLHPYVCASFHSSSIKSKPLKYSIYKTSR